MVSPAEALYPSESAGTAYVTIPLAGAMISLASSGAGVILPPHRITPANGASVAFWVCSPALAACCGVKCISPSAKCSSWSSSTVWLVFAHPAASMAAMIIAVYFFVFMLFVVCPFGVCVAFVFINAGRMLFCKVFLSCMLFCFFCCFYTVYGGARNGTAVLMFGGVYESLLMGMIILAFASTVVCSCVIAVGTALWK